MSKRNARSRAPMPVIQAEPVAPVEINVEPAQIDASDIDAVTETDREIAPDVAAAEPSLVDRESEPAQVDAPVIETVNPTDIDPDIDKDETFPSDLEAEMAWLQLKTGLSGPDFSLAPGDKRQFSNAPGPDGEPSEAQRLVDAGYARFSAPPED